MGAGRIALVGSIAFAALCQHQAGLAQSAPASTAEGREGRPTATDEAADIIVTAQKRNERALDVPMALTAIDAQALAAQNIVQLKDYFTRIPGLNLNGRNSGLATLAIRGITTGAGTNPTVAVTVDDIPYGSASSAGYGDLITLDLDPSDLARIEILKGPQGTLYGASSLGGLIKYVTADPDTREVSGRVQADVSTVAHASDPGYAGRAAVNVPLIADKLAIRISGYHRHDPGFIDNVQTGQRDTNDGTAEGGRVALLWKPVDIVSIKLAALLQDTSGDDASTVDVADLALTPQFGRYDHSRLPGTDSFRNKARFYTAVGNVDLGGATLTSLSGWADNRYAGLSDVSGTFGRFSELPGSAIAFNNRFHTTRYSQEVRLASSGAHTIDWLVGGFYTREHSLGLQTFNELTPVSGAYRQLLGDYVYRFGYREYAGFGALTVHFTPKFDVQIGSRYAHNTQRYDESGTGPLDGDYRVDTRRARGSAFTWLVTPRFRFSEDAMAYVRVASGYRPGGFNSNANQVIPESFDPDRTINYELGLKGNFLDRVLTLEAAAFWIDWTKIQLLQRDATGNSFYSNGGRARSKGVEVQATVRPVAGLSVAGAVTYTDARLRQDIVPAIYGFAGDRLPYSARWASSVNADYRMRISEPLTGLLGATFAYVGKRQNEFVSRATQPRITLPDFTTIDLRAGVEIERWQVQLFAKNVTDKRGYVSGVPRDTIGKQAPFQLNLISPRTLGLSISRSL